MILREGKVIFLEKAKKVSSGKEKKAKPKYNMLQNVGFMISVSWKSKEKKIILICLLIICFSVLGNILNLYVTPAIISAVEEHLPLHELILTIVIFAGALMLVGMATVYLNSNKMFGRVTVRCEILGMINKKSACTSYPNLYDEKFNALYSKTADSVKNNASASEAVWDTLTSLLTDICCFAIYVSLLSGIHPLMLLVVLATTVAAYFVNNYVGSYGYRHREEEAVYTTKLWYMRNKSTDWSAAKDIRIFGLREWFMELYTKALDGYTAFQNKVQGVLLWAHFTNILTAFLRNGIAYAYLIGLVLANDITVSQFLLLFSAVGGFTSYVSGIFGGLNALHRQSLDISTVREFIEYPEPFELENGEALEPDEYGKYEIKLENVSFRYPGASEDTLKDINLTIHPGEKLAVVGLNGAGKTTLVKLICGLYDPTSGRILLNGKDIRQYNRRDYYRMFSAVFQNFKVLAGTVAENIAQAVDGIDMELVKECAEKADLGDKIESLKDGYETKLERTVFQDATSLSGGETQRLMLARALYKKSPVIILDEPTAALDPIAESRMYLKYDEMTKGKSSVYISHRLASTRFCDRIIFIDGSRIAEEGTHEQLLRKKGRYAELFEVQSQYYREGEAANEEG